MRKILFLLGILASFQCMQAQTSATIRYDADIETIRQRIVDDLLEPPVEADDIKKIAGSIRPDGSWPDINYKDVSRTGFEHSRHLQYMVDLSRAYRKNSSALYNDPSIKKAVSAALDFWLAHDFICQNWWWNEMGTPNQMINTLLLLDTDLTEKQRTAGLKIAHRANLETFGARPGGDLIVIAGMLGKQALFMHNPDTLAKVIKVMASEIKFTNELRGLQRDLSFHHRTDNVISTLSYGTGFASAFSYWAAKTVGTKYALPQDGLKLLTDYYLGGICASMAYGKFPDPGAKNRDISRKKTLDAVGPDVAENLLRASSYRAKELQDIIKLRNGEKATVRSFDKFFWHSEYYTHQRPNYFTSVRMHSSRQNNMEQPHNEEGLKNHHYGDGASFITITGKEYVDIFPAWDWQKIPGTTIVQQPALPHWNDLAKKGLTDFVGGVTNGSYGAAVFDFACVHDPLKARKSWFFFDKEYVCLGAGIQSKADYPVVTTLNQCLLNGDVIVQTDKGQQKPMHGKHALNNVAWVWHDKVGYVFPESVDINCNNTTQSGSWRSINHQAWATDEIVKKDIFCLWFDHGPRPTKASYSYIVVPNMESTAVAAYNKKLAIEILSNTPELQAVRHKELQITQIVFYTPGEIQLSKDVKVEAKNPCMLMVTMNGKKVKSITASDPSRKLSTLEFIFTVGKKSTLIPVELMTQDGYAGNSINVFNLPL